MKRTMTTLLLMQDREFNEIYQFDNPRQKLTREQDPRRYNFNAFRNHQISVRMQLTLQGDQITKNKLIN